MHFWADGVNIAFNRAAQELLVKFLLRGLATETVIVSAATSQQIVAEIENHESSFAWKLDERVDNQEPQISSADWANRRTVQYFVLRHHLGQFIFVFYVTQGLAREVALSPPLAHLYRVRIQRTLELLCSPSGVQEEARSD